MALAGKTVKQLAGSGTGQSLADRVNAAKHSITGSGVAKTVCKATTEEISAPKSKHIEYLVQCTNEANVSIPDLANLLIERTHHHSWIVVFKGLISIHNVMNYGNERFSQYLASNNCQISLPNFTDKSGVQAYDMSMFIRHYSKYLNEKAASYRTMAFDFCKIKRGKEDGVLRTMPLEKLLKTLPMLQKQLDVLLEFDATSNEITNKVVNVAFILIYKDLIRLFATYNEGMINLIEKYFIMNKKQCREALELYKHFLNRMDKVNHFLKVAENIGCGDKDGLGLQPVPSTVLESLEEHLAQLEGRKFTRSVMEAPSSSNTSQNGTKTGNSSSSSYALSDSDKQRIIEEEKRRLAEFSAKNKSSSSGGSHSVVANSSSPSTLSNSSTGNAANLSAQSAAKPSDDLLMLNNDPAPSNAFTSNNPFASSSSSSLAMTTAAASPWQDFSAQQQQQTFNNQRFYMPYSHSASNLSTGVNFEAAFGNTHQHQSYNSFDQILQPTSAGSTSYQPPSSQPAAIMPAAMSSVTPSSALTNDLDSSLASLAGNLTVGGPNQFHKTEMKWKQPSPQMQQKSIGSSPQSSQNMATAINWAAPGNVPAPPIMSNQFSFSSNNPFLVPQVNAPNSYSYAQPVQMVQWPSHMMRMPAMHPGQMGAGYPGYGAPITSAPYRMNNQTSFPTGMAQNQMTSQPQQSQQVNDPFGAL